MALKIILNEASPRKFRQSPATRGVGGKWGPAGEDSLITARGSRSKSAQAWYDNAGNDATMQAMLSSKIGTVPGGWEFDSDYSTNDTMTFCCYDPTEIFGFNLSNINITPAILSEPDSSLDATSKGGTSVERLLEKICVNVSDKDDCGGAGCWLSFGTDDSMDGYSSMTLSITRPVLSDLKGEEGIPFPSREEFVTDMVDTVGKVTEYLKKMAPTIQREMSRSYNESRHHRT